VRRMLQWSECVKYIQYLSDLFPFCLSRLFHIVLLILFFVFIRFKPRCHSCLSKISLFILDKPSIFCNLLLLLVRIFLSILVCYFCSGLREKITLVNTLLWKINCIVEKIVRYFVLIPCLLN